MDSLKAQQAAIAAYHEGHPWSTAGTYFILYIIVTGLSLPGATVLSYYRALGDVPDGRRRLLETPFAGWRDSILAELAQAHPDLPRKARRVDITRYGHAMAIPVPGLPLPAPPPVGRLRFAHSDWAGYSVFEEAFAQGHAAASGQPP